MKLILVGFLIGIGKIIPGVSGAVMAIRFHVYERAIIAITHFFEDLYNNLFYLGRLAVGFVLAVLLFSNVILSLYQDYPMIMTVIFSILILTGAPEIYNKANSKIIVLCTFLLTLLLNYIPSLSINGNDIFIIMILGLIESISIIIPGVSGTAILVSLGLYQYYLSLFTNLNISLLIPFMISFFIFSLIIINIINYVIQKYSKSFYSAILGFLCGSVILMFI